MKLFTLALILLISFSSQSPSDEFVEFKSIDKDPFGRTLIDTLMLHIQSSDSLAHFMDMMREIENQIEEGQRDDDKRNKEFQEMCNKDLQDLDKYQNELQLRQTEIQSLIDEFAEAKGRKEAILNAKSTWNKELKEQIDSYQTQRDEEKKSYEEKTKENEFVIYVIEQVKHLFDEGNDRSFLQVDAKAMSLATPEILTKVESQLTKAQEEASIYQIINKYFQGQFKFNSNYGNMFQVLGEIANKIKDNINTSYVKSVLEVCEQLLKNIEDNQSLERKQEDRRVDLFQKQMKLLQKDVQKIEQDVANANAELLTVQNRLNDAQNDLSDTKQRFEQKKKQKEDRDIECKNDAYSYKQNREDNDKKRSLVSQVIGLFSANAREFKDYIAQRTQAGDFE